MCAVEYALNLMCAQLVNTVLVRKIPIEDNVIYRCPRFQFQPNADNYKVQRKAQQAEKGWRCIREFRAEIHYPKILTHKMNGTGISRIRISL